MNAKGLTEDERAIADSLRHAYGRRPVAPIRTKVRDATPETGYRIQHHNTGYWLDHGRRIAGYKIGLTAEVVQQQLGVDQPDFGVLFDDMQLREGQPAPCSWLLQPRAEAEVALILGRRLDDEALDHASLIAAVEFLAPAIEIVDSRIADWDIGICDTVADNASSGLFVLGSSRVRPRDVDIIASQMSMRRGTEIVSQGAGSAGMGSPYRAALWLARKMISLGRPLEPGQIIFTGALGPMIAARPNDRFHAEIEGLGEVSATFDNGAQLALPWQ